MRNLIGLSIALFALQGCGSDSSTPADMTVVSTEDMAMPLDMTTPPVNNGTLLMAASLFVGTTSDDHVVAFAQSPGGVITVPLAGGTPTTVDPLGASVVVSGKTIFSWSGIAGAATVGTLTVWSSTMTTPRKASTKSFAGAASASTDGTYIAYTDNAVNAGSADIYVGKLDGTGTATKVATGADTTNTACPITIVYVGSGFFLNYCTGDAAKDMGMTASTLAYVDPAAGTPAPVVISSMADSGSFSVDTAGDKAWFLDGSKTLFYSAAPFATSTMVDTNVTRALIKGDGSALVWSNGTALKRAATSALTTVTTLVGSGVNALISESTDEKMGIVSDVAPDATSGEFNIAYTSIETAGTPTKLVTDKSGILYGPAFTPDSQTVLWYDQTMTNVANFHQTAIGSGMSKKIADAVWNHQTANGSKILYMDHYKAPPSSTQTGTCSLSLYDLASGTATLIATGAQARDTITVSTDKTKVLYDYQVKAKAMSGVYVAPAQ